MTDIREKFKRALGDILVRVFFSEGGDVDPAYVKRPALAIAYSGGLDSSVLLHLAKEYASVRGMLLYAFHVHHGLSPNADAWLSHCDKECGRLGVRFESRRVAVSKEGGTGLEAAARASRYAALGDMCRTHGIRLLLTAHHQDDQAETVLLQMLRGAGVAGLSGMDLANVAPALLGSADITLARPLLSLARAELATCMAGLDASHIEDESNADLHYSRNALRHRIMPLLQEYFPGFQDRVARSARHAQFAQRILDQTAQTDWESCRENDWLRMDAVRNLDQDRFSNVLRFWLGKRGLHMPTTAWLQQAQEQLLVAREDAQVCITLTDHEIRRYRNRIMLVPNTRHNVYENVLFTWCGEKRVCLSEYGGTLTFEMAKQGVDGDWLRGRSLEVRGYRGELRLKVAHDRPSRSLKLHFQERGIPAWERRQLPLLFSDGDLIYAAGIGMASRYLAEGDKTCIHISWEPGSGLGTAS